MLLEARGLVKVFPGVVALKDATLKLPRGQTHALLGENGAGKSTLLKILTGVHAPDGGELIYEGGPLTLAGPGDATAKGIAIIHQELSLVPDLSIAENIFLGDEPLRRRLPDFATMRARAKELIGKLGLTIDPGEPVRGLTVAEQQLVEIARSRAPITSNRRSDSRCESAAVGSSIASRRVGRRNERAISTSCCSATVRPRTGSPRSSACANARRSCATAPPSVTSRSARRPRRTRSSA